MPPQKSQSLAGPGHTSCWRPSISAWNGSNFGRLQTLYGGGSNCHRLCQGEACKDSCNRHLGGADDTVSSTVVDRQIVAINEVAIGEDNVAEKALLLISSQRLHDWGFGAGDHAPGLVKIKQKSTKTVAIFLGRAVINLQPTLVS